MLLILLCFITIVYYIKESERIQVLIRLCNLNSTKLNAYFDSYNKIFSDNNMISTLDDFNNNVPPSRFIIQNEIKPSKFTADCYSILNDLCSLGNVKKMYIPKCIDINKTFIENQNLYEGEVAKKLNVSSNKTLLEIGSGCGRIAYHISTLTDCTVYGINIDEKQINDAISYSKSKKYNKTKFLFCDLNDNLPFNDETFDGIYEFGAFTSFISDYDKVFKELYRVLKPGGRFLISDAVLLDPFDRNDEHHLKLIKNSRMVMAGGVFLHYKYFESIAKKVGFKIISSSGGIPPNEAADLPMLIKEHENFNRIEKIITILTKMYILPKYMNDLIKRLRSGGNDLVEMEKKNLLTTIWDFNFEKPK